METARDWEAVVAPFHSEIQGLQDELAGAPDGAEEAEAGSIE
jgi:hypothetical protein